jgi:hypothetical protein
MKKLLLSVLVASSFMLFNSCDKSIFSFNVEQAVSAGVIVIGATSEVGSTDFTESISGLNIDSILEANGVKAADIQSVTVKSIVLEIINPVDATFDPIGEFKATIETAGFEPISVTNYEGFPEGSTTVKIEEEDLTDVNLMDYISANEFLLYGLMSNDLPVDEALTVSMTLYLNIKAGK